MRSVTARFTRGVLRPWIVAPVLAAALLALPRDASAQLSCRAIVIFSGEITLSAPLTETIRMTNPDPQVVDGLPIPGGPCEYSIRASWLAVRIENGEGTLPPSPFDQSVTYRMSMNGQFPNKTCQDRLFRIELRTSLTITFGTFDSLQTLKIIRQPRRPSELQPDGTTKCVPIPDPPRRPSHDAQGGIFGMGVRG